VERAFWVEASDQLSEEEGLNKIFFLMVDKEFRITEASTSGSLDRLYAAMMNLRERVTGLSRELLDNSFLSFIPTHLIAPLVYSALRGDDRDSLRSLTRLGLAEKALLVMPEMRWFLIRHYGTVEQKVQKARARQQEKDAVKDAPPKASQSEA
jgi:hypothetical protein